MSKRMNRVAVAVLISLLIVAGVATTVLGASAHVGMTHGSIHMTGGLLVDVSHARMGAFSMNDYYSDLDRPAQFHDCGDGESAFDPND